MRMAGRSEEPELDGQQPTHHDSPDANYLGSASRRSSLKGGALAFSLLVSGIQGQANGQSGFAFRGCCLLDGGQAFLTMLRIAGMLGLQRIPGSFERHDRSGNDRFDRSFGEVLADLSAKFQQRPGFFYYNEGVGINAIAMPFTAYPATKGTVGVGFNLLRRALNLGPGGHLFLTGVTAHEFAHIHQFFSPALKAIFNRLPTKYAEHHADFLAGYYLGLGRSYSANELVTLGLEWEELGGSTSHGTREERISAIEEGYRVSRGRSGVSLTRASQLGMQYLKLS